jgi:hypothetical protein
MGVKTKDEERERKGEREGRFDVRFQKEGSKPCVGNPPHESAYGGQVAGKSAKKSGG